MFIHCRNSKCKKYYEDGCTDNVNNIMVIFNEEGKCESQEEGTSDWYDTTNSNMCDVCGKPCESMYYSKTQKGHKICLR
jgi:hypothetical protein